MMSAEDLAEFERMMDESRMAFDRFENYQGMGQFGAFTNLFMLVYFVLWLIVFIRFLQAIFSFYILFDEEKIDSKKALEKSIKITQGNLWRIIGYSIVIGLLMILIGGVLGWIGLNIYSAFTDTAFIIVNIIINLVVGSILMPLPVIFYYIFYKGLRKEKGLFSK
jgi:hypothetical protein